MTKDVFVISVATFGVIALSGCNSDGSNLDMLNGEKPVITLEGDTEISIPLGTTSILADDKFSAYDPQDGDLTPYVQRTHNIDFSRAGEYEVKYYVEDQDGNSDVKTRRVIITDGNYQLYNGGQQYTGSPPEIIFTDDSETRFIALGEPFNDTAYRATDFEDGDLTSRVIVDKSELNVYQEGTYTVTYSVTDNDENTVYKYRTVYVGDYGYNSDYNWAEENSNNTIDDFKNWYSSVCGKQFQSSLYNPNTGQYNGTIDCSYRNLTYIDLTTLSIFSTIKSLNLSHNRLTDIDFNQLDLVENNVKVLEILDLSYNNFSYIDFTPLHNLKNINELWIQGNNLDYDTVEKREALYRIFNNRSLTIYF